MNNYVVFFNNGSVIEINASGFDWDDDNETLSVYDDNENDVAKFKLKSLFGVSMSNYRVHKEVLALPVFDDVNESNESN